MMTRCCVQLRVFRNSNPLLSALPCGLDFAPLRRREAPESGAMGPFARPHSTGSVTQAGSMITVNGTRFSPLTVINLFNRAGRRCGQPRRASTGGVPRIALTLQANVTNPEMQRPRQEMLAQNLTNVAFRCAVLPLATSNVETIRYGLWISLPPHWIS